LNAAPEHEAPVTIHELANNDRAILKTLAETKMRDDHTLLSNAMDKKLDSYH
jgi:hypothetical protein